MSDIGADDLFADIDLGEDLLPPIDEPADAPVTEPLADDEVVTEFWYSEVIEVSSAAPAVIELVLPDPFEVETAVGAAAAVGGWVARKLKSRKQAEPTGEAQ
jgi:hypothetical protein